MELSDGLQILLQVSLRIYEARHTGDVDVAIHKPRHDGLAGRIDLFRLRGHRDFSAFSHRRDLIAVHQHNARFDGRTSGAIYHAAVYDRLLTFHTLSFGSHAHREEHDYGNNPVLLTRRIMLFWQGFYEGGW